MVVRGDIIGKIESSLGLYAVFFSSKLGRAYMDICYIFQFFYAWIIYSNKKSKLENRRCKWHRKKLFQKVLGIG